MLSLKSKSFYSQTLRWWHSKTTQCGHSNDQFGLTQLQSICRDFRDWSQSPSDGCAKAWSIYFRSIDTIQIKVILSSDRKIYSQIKFLKNAAKSSRNRYLGYWYFLRKAVFFILYLIIMALTWQKNLCLESRFIIDSQNRLMFLMELKSCSFIERSGDM